MKLSVQDNLVPGNTLKEKLGLLEELGFAGIELWGRPQLNEKLTEYRDIFSSYRVKPSVICAGYGGDLLSPDKSARHEAIEGINKRLEWASALGALGVIFVPTFGGPKIPDLDPLYPSVVELEKRLLIAECKILAKKGEDVGAYAILEPLNRYETHLINRLEQAVEVLNEVSSDGLRIMADFFHMNIEESDIGQALRDSSDYIVHVHLADSNRQIPGKGHTDFSPISQLLAKGYDRYFSLECRIPGDPINELKDFRRFIERCARR